MAELTFACPLCHKDIVCDEAWCDHQIQCPLCQGNITVPRNETPSIATAAEIGNPLVPKPPPPGSSRLSIKQQAQQAATTGNRNIPIRTLTEAPPPKKSPVGAIITTVVVLIGLGVGGFFGYQWYQQKFAAGSSDGDKAKTTASPTNATPRAGTVSPADRAGVVQ